MTPEQAEIVRGFVAGDSSFGICYRDPSLSKKDIESALRAALIEKDAEIERLNLEIADLVAAMLRCLARERDALEAGLAEARREFAREALAKYDEELNTGDFLAEDASVLPHFTSDDLYADWLRREAEGKGGK